MRLMIDSRNEKELTEWLRRQSPRANIVFAARAALRVLPKLAYDQTGSSLDKSGQVWPQKVDSEVVLMAFRAVAVALTTAEFWKHRKSLTKFADLAADEALGMEELVGTNPYGTAMTNMVLEVAAQAAEAVVRDDSFKIAKAFQVGNKIAKPEVIERDDLGKVDYPADVVAFGKDPDAYANAAQADIEVITSWGPRQVAGNSIWPNGQPIWSYDAWFLLKKDLLKLNQDWRVWIDWYEARLHGRKERSEEVELAFVNIADEVWRRGSKAINAEIARKIDALSKSQLTTKQNEAPVLRPPKIPAGKPAAVQPVWKDWQLNLPDSSARSNLRKQALKAALSTLRSELRAIARDAGGEANIDKRVVRFFETAADRVPKKEPRQFETFRLGHLQEFVVAYGKTVSAEWPDYLAHRYHALSIHFDRTLQQFPDWREFKRNAEIQSISEEQISHLPALTSAVASALREKDAALYVNAAVAGALGGLSTLLSSDNHQLGISEQNAAKEASVAVDVIESLNNTLKKIAEMALQGPVARGVSDTARKAGRGYIDEFQKGVVQEAKRQGKKDGAATVRWARRFIVGGGITIGGLISGPSLINWLAATFPIQFGWLESVAIFVRSILN
jgi:hypothetical protein